MNTNSLERAILATCLLSDIYGIEIDFSPDENFFEGYLHKYLARTISKGLEKNIPLRLLGYKIDEAIRGTSNEQEYLEILATTPLVNLKYYYKMLKVESIRKKVEK